MWNLSRNALNVWYASYSWYYEPIIMTSDMKCLHWDPFGLVLVGHRNSLWNTQKQLKYMELITNNTQNANTVPVYAVEAT